MPDQPTDLAAKIGSASGRNAATWIFDGSTSDDSYRTILRGIEDGDPAILDSYRTPDLSGEYADDYSERDLLADLGITPDDSDQYEYEALVSECAAAYCDAASEAFWAEVERIAHDHIETDKIVGLRDAGYKVQWIDPAGIDSAGYISPYDHYRHDVPVPDGRAWVDLSSVAKDEDAYGQSSTLERSNYRSLERDYPEVWTPVGWTNVNGLGAFLADLTPELVDVLAGLSEYPVYDEDDMTELEQDEISEQWDDFGAWELGEQLPEDAQQVWQDMTPDAQRELFDKACQVAGYYPEHAGTEVLWSYAYERTVPFIASQLGAAS